MVTNPFTALYTTLQLNTDFHALTSTHMPCASQISSHDITVS